MKSITAIILILLLELICLAPKLSWAQLMTCPQVCSCIWRNGKQTTICENQNLISIPNQISPSTQVLDLNNNNFQILPSKAFQERGLINLQKLFLPHCKLGAIADDAFHQLTNLVELDLSDNLLTHVPVKALSNATNLRRLLLNNNHITTITAESFQALGNLKFLNLSGCKTHTIEARAFYGLRDLEYLYLHNNQLTTLPYSVVVDLPALYSFELYRNPWQCNCEMRSTREWMIRNNVGQSIPPTCDLPIRLSGLMWNSLDLDDFACEPDIITTNVEVAKPVGQNATLLCVVKGLPEPKVFWYMDHGYYNLSSNHPQRSQKYHLSEERTEGTVQSILTIINLDPSDDGNSFICSGENRAGIKSKNFTVYVVPTGAFGSTAHWSKVELAGGLLGLLIILVFAFVVITLILIRSKKLPLGGNQDDLKSSSRQDHHQQHSSDSLEKKKPLGKILNGTTGSTIYPNSTIHQHALSMLGLDGIDKKPEIFLKTTNQNNQNQINNNNHLQQQQQNPDLIQQQQFFNSNQHLLSSGYELNHFNNNNNGQQVHNFINDPQYQQQQQHQDTLFLNDPGQQYGYQQPTTTLQDNSGLYRAVMIPPSVITTTNSTSGLLSSAPQTNSSTLTASGGTAPSPTNNGGSGGGTAFMLSATNLYNQYLSQYDLSNVNVNGNNGQHSHISTGTPPQQNQYHFQPSNSSPSPLVYGNPGFISDSGCLQHHLPSSTMLYNNNGGDNSCDDDDVFRSSVPPPLPNPTTTTAMMLDHQTLMIVPQHQQQQQFNYNNNNTPSPPLLPYRQPSVMNLVNNNSESIYGVRRTPLPNNPFSLAPTHLAPPTPQQQQQAIYGVTVLKNRWNSGGTLTPNGQLHFQQQQPSTQLSQRSNNNNLLTTTTSLSNIRYSPDEGYGEESSNSGPTVGQLEGTEV